MKLEKILEALSRVDELGEGIFDGCIVGQLFYACGKTENELKSAYWAKGTGGVGYAGRYANMFGGLLGKEYGVSRDDLRLMYGINDGGRDPKERHSRVVAHYEGLLIEELIAESVEVEEVLVEA